MTLSEAHANQTILSLSDFVISCLLCTSHPFLFSFWHASVGWVGLGAPGQAAFW